tara:strand:- start:3503 stop:3988 length:486 start_codon:yes stop_codon:yes gene_type:complete
MAYSGKYTVKNPNKYDGNSTKVVYRSLWEKYCFMWCDSQSTVKKWSSEEVVIPYLYEVDKRYHRYFMDLKITYTNGRTMLVEIKPDKETRPPKFTGRKTKRYINEGLTYVKNMNKWAAAQNFAADRGWGFEIWTEDTLHKMGIKPKSTKPLKPYKKPKKKT